MRATIPINKPMKQLEDASALVEDRRGLDKFWQNNGYLFLRGVFSESTIASVRDPLVHVLTEYGFVQPGSSPPAWSGRDFSDFGTRPQSIYELNLAENFFETPEVKHLLARVLGEEPVYVPIDVYRFTPPVTAGGAEKHVGLPHQDGYFNRGYNFRILWVPLIDVDERTGGLALAPGAYKRGHLHNPDEPPSFPIPKDAISEDEWARADYRAGDLLMMHQDTPHGGLTNHSANLRLTMDFRIAAASDRCPVFGNVVSVSPDEIRVRSRDGHERTFALDDNTFVLRVPGIARIHRGDIEQHWKTNDHVIVGPSDTDPNRAALIRNVN